MEKYLNGYPTTQYIHKLCDILGVNRNAIIPCAEYGEKSGVIYYKSDIANRTIDTFAKFLIYNKVDVKTWDEKRIELNINTKEI